MSVETEAVPETGALPIGPGLTRALDAIIELSRSLGLAASRVPADAQQLSVRIADEAGETLILLVEPLRRERNYYRANDWLGLWYLREQESAGSTPVWTGPAIDGVARIVFSPQHQALAGELAARVQDTTGMSNSLGPGTAHGPPQPKIPPATSIDGFTGRFPASTRSVLRALLKPLYDRYVSRILSMYLPVEARGARCVLDAMCGRNLPNLAALRRHCTDAHIVAIDIDIDLRRMVPPGTSVLQGNLLVPLAPKLRYQLITLFKPPTGLLEARMETVLAHLAAALEPAGYLFIVFGFLSGIEEAAETLRRLNLSILTSEPNRVTNFLEAEHVWILVAQAPR